MPRKQKQEEPQTEKRRRTKHQTAPETPFDETLAAGEPIGAVETEVHPEETVEASAGGEQTSSETAAAEPIGDLEMDVRPEEPIETSVEGEQTATGEPVGDSETDVRLEEPVEAFAEVEQTANETIDETSAQPAAEQPPAGDAKPELDTPTALALKRWRERPTCCCGCGQPLSSAKKNFAQGHDGRAKKIIRRIMKGELPAGEAPVELILRHAEIKFVMRSPEFGRVVEAWREICAFAGIAAGK